MKKTALMFPRHEFCVAGSSSKKFESLVELTYARPTGTAEQQSAAAVDPLGLSNVLLCRATLVYRSVSRVTD